MIIVDQLTKSFPLASGEDLLAVDRVSFRAHAGQVYGLLGPNGAGKTTTIRMILGLLSPTSGCASIDGFDSASTPDEVKRRVGLVAASAGVYQWLTVREMLFFFADLYGVPFEQSKERLDQLASLFGIAELLGRSCANLSTGQRQRVSLARAMMHDPPVMLLDEPTLGLDVMGSQVVFEFVRHVRETGKAVILSTHRLDEAERLCDRFGLLHRGKLVAEGTLEELRSDTQCQDLVSMFLKLSGAKPTIRSDGHGEPFA